MKFFKKTLTLRLPMWLLMVLEAVAVLFVAVAILLQTSIPKTLQLRFLRPDRIASAQLTYYGWGTEQKAILTEEDVAAAVKLVNQARLSGKPYKVFPIGGGPEIITFSLTDGTTLEFGVIGSSDYFYCVDGEYYYICSDDSSGDLDLYNQWMQLHEDLCVKHLGEDYDQNPFPPTQ